MLHQLSLNCVDALRAGRSYDPLGLNSPASSESGTDNATADDEETQEDFWDVSNAGSIGDPVMILRQYRLDADEAARLAREARDTAVRIGFGRHITPFRPGEPGYTGEPRFQVIIADRTVDRTVQV